MNFFSFLLLLITFYLTSCAFHYKNTLPEKVSTTKKVKQKIAIRFFNCKSTRHNNGNCSLSSINQKTELLTAFRNSIEELGVFEDVVYLRSHQEQALYTPEISFSESIDNFFPKAPCGYQVLDFLFKEGPCTSGCSQSMYPGLISFASLGIIPIFQGGKFSMELKSKEVSVKTFGEYNGHTSVWANLQDHPVHFVKVRKSSNDFALKQEFQKAILKALSDNLL